MRQLEGRWRLREAKKIDEKEKVYLEKYMRLVEKEKDEFFKVLFFKLVQALAQGNVENSPS